MDILPPVEALKIGLKFDPPTLALYYKRKEKNNKKKKYIYEILLNGLIELRNSDAITKRLFAEHALYLNEGVVEYEQVKKLVKRLVQAHYKYSGAQDDFDTERIDEETQQYGEDDLIDEADVHAYYDNQYVPNMDDAYLEEQYNNNNNISNSNNNNNNNVNYGGVDFVPDEGAVWYEEQAYGTPQTRGNKNTVYQTQEFAYQQQAPQHFVEPYGLQNQAFAAVTGNGFYAQKSRLEGAYGMVNAQQQQQILLQ